MLPSLGSLLLITWLLRLPSPTDIALASGWGASATVYVVVGWRRMGVRLTPRGLIIVSRVRSEIVQWESIVTIHISWESSGMGTGDIVCGSSHASSPPKITSSWGIDAAR